MTRFGPGLVRPWGPILAFGPNFGLGFRVCFGMGLESPIPYFMWSDCIHVVKPPDLFFRLGGKLNSPVTQILLSVQERALPHHIEFKELKELMDKPRLDTVPKERHALNSMCTSKLWLSVSL